MKNTKALFIDKDGTLIRNIPNNVDSNYIDIDVEVVHKLLQLKKRGYRIVLVTNQSGIGNGYIEESDMEIVERKINQILYEKDLLLDGYYYCPHHPEALLDDYRKECDGRKPMPGMLTRASDDLQIDLKKSWMIGDILDDMEAGRRAGCKTVFLDVGNETEWEISNLRMPDYSAKSLLDALDLILKQEKENPNENRKNLFQY